VNYWFIAFLVTLLLSIACVLALIVGWDITPEAIEWKATDAGKLLVHARSFFVAACAVIFACLGVLIYFLDAPDNSQPFRWCDEHRHCLPLLIFVSSGMSGLSHLLALSGKGEGRRTLLIAASVIGVLSIVAACLLMSS
jgi:hypothetical protein